MIEVSNLCVDYNIEKKESMDDTKSLVYVEQKSNIKPLIGSYYNKACRKNYFVESGNSDRNTAIDRSNGGTQTQDVERVPLPNIEDIDESGFLKSLEDTSSQK